MLSHFENIILQPYFENRTVLSYWRYVDDTILIVDKKYCSEIFTKFNNFHKNIKWTSTEMIENKLRFLDTIVYKDENSNLQLRNFSKPDSQSGFMDFNSISPKHMKFSLIATETYRMNSCSTNKFDLEKSLNAVKMSSLTLSWQI